MVLHLTILYKPYGTKYSKIDQLKYVEDSLKQIICVQLFQRLSSANFTWSILGYFVPYTLQFL